MKKVLRKIVPKLYGTYFNLLVLLDKKKLAEKAFTTFCTIRKGRVLPHQEEYLNACKDDLIEIEGHRIQTYEWSGKKDTVLLVHGWESNTFRWRNLIARLQEDDYHIVAFDAPAHGNSSGKMLYVPLYEKVLEFLVQHYRPNYLIGHSVGGMTVLYNQYRNPKSAIEKVITIGSPSEFHELMSQYQKLLGYNNQVMNALDDYILNRFGFHIREFSTTEYAKSIQKKGLLLHDRFDKIAPYHASANVHANWKGSKLISTEGLGHSMHQPQVNEHILDFLKS